MSDVVLLCGPAGAGKTTWARELTARSYLRVSYDEEIWLLGWDASNAPPAALAESDRRVREKVRDAVGKGVDVVLDASLSTRAIRDELRAFVREAGGNPRLVVLDAPLEVLLQRVRRREGLDADSLRLEEAALRDYHASFEYPGPDEPHELVRTG